MTQARDLANFISNGLADTAEVADGAITEAKLASASVTDTKVASGITGTKISYDNSVSGISANTMQEAVDYLNALSGGSSGSVASYTRSKFTATAGQTTFAVTYQVGYLEVYLNGVLLDITDYAASDGTSVVLAVGASAGDEIVTIALDSFAIAELLRIFSTSASAPDDSVTVDSSGNLLVGKTDTTFSTAGLVLNSQYNVIQATRDQGNPVELNRTTSDGDIIKFYKDGTTVGSIGADGGAIYIGNTAGEQFKFHNGTGGSFYPKTDNNNDLGASGNRFKNLYLSGGVYLGGTGAANLLDDYEEGTWTPTVSSGSVTASESRYTKIGRMVTVSTLLTSFSDRTSSTFISIGGLPFAAQGYVTSSSIMYQYVLTPNGGDHLSTYTGTGGTAFGLYSSVGSASAGYTLLRHVDLRSASSNFFMTVVYTAS